MTQGCMLCPRMCGAKRLDGERGFCGADAHLRVARAALHRWEEPCISVGAGSGAVFFSGCSLRCVFCQNAVISRGEAGAIVSEERLEEILFELKAQGAANINLVTPTHYADILRRVLLRAKRNGLALPIVYNCGGYESVQTLRMLQGLIDVYMPDFKYMDASLASRLSGAADYPSVAMRALDEMVRQRPFVSFDGERMTSGVLVRHLVLPGHEDDSMQIMRHLARRYETDIYVSIMRQYTPPQNASLPEELTRRVTDAQYDAVVSLAQELGLLAYTQSDESVGESFIPQFDLLGVLESAHTEDER